MYVIKPDNAKVPAKIWAEEGTIEESAMKQIENCLQLPFIFDHLAVMPDCHAGKGVTIGSVLVTEGVVIPNAVGLDIGCGMISVKTSLKVDQIDRETLKKIMGEIRKVVPIGVGVIHTTPQDKSFMPETPSYCWSDKYYIFQKEEDNALKSIGTLGAGNHFIEIQKDSNDSVWLMVHSGSRNLGKQVADHYSEVAYNLNKKWHSNTYLSKKKEESLAFLPLDSVEGRDYLREMQYCVDFALANRKLMLQRIIDVFAQFYPTDLPWNSEDWRFKVEPFTNIAHNYASIEHHFGKDVVVHRKGATLAREGTIGIIPGSQGTKSYIVRGLGNKDSFESCSHGAGRTMSRGAARKNLNLADEIKRMEEKGVVHGIRSEKDLDEAASAYKDIDQVMANQQDLVEVLVELEPLAVIKGD